MFGQTHARDEAVPAVPMALGSPGLGPRTAGATQEPRSINDLLTVPPQQPAPAQQPDPQAVPFEPGESPTIGETGNSDTLSGDTLGGDTLSGNTLSGNAGQEFLQQLQALGWVDTTAVVLLLVFFVVGLFKGLFWQVSRIAILVLAYLVAGRFGGDVGNWLARDLQRETGSPDTMLYLAYVLVFLGVVVILSLLAMQFQKVLKQTGLTFFDRLGGGVFGVATGACTVLFLLFFVNMFFRETSLGNEVQASHSQRLSRRAIDWLGPRVPDELRGALYLAPLSASAADPNPADHGGPGPRVAPPPATSPDGAANARQNGEEARSTGSGSGTGSGRER